DGIRGRNVTGVQTCALPISSAFSFLSENADVAFGLATVPVAVRVRFYEFNRLYEHAARTAAGVEYAALIWGEHFDEELDDATGRSEERRVGRGCRCWRCQYQ